MKIALVAPTYLPARRANTVQVMKMAQAMTILGHQVQVLVPLASRDISEDKPNWDQLARHYGLQYQFEVQWLPAKRWMRRYDYGFKAVRSAGRWGAELVYTRLPQAAVLAGLMGMDTVYEVHDIPTGTVGPILFRSYSNTRGARRLVVITEALKNDLVELYGIPDSASFTLVAHDGVDLVRYQDVPNPRDARRSLDAELEFQLAVDRFTVGYSGHLYSGRGVALMMEMAEHLPSIQFLLAGGEPDEVGKLRLEVDSRGLENVILTGFVPNAVLPRYQAACEVLLMPYQRKVAGSSGGDISRYLSPMKLFEYMACSRTILSSDLPVFSEVLNERNAVLLTPDDADVWVSGIKQMRSDPQFRSILAAQARRDVEQYTWEARAERILAGLG